MNRINIPRDDQRKSNVAPSPAWVIDNLGDVWIRCQCGELLALDHDIDADGNVNPSLYHEPGCGWHVFGTLEGWEPVN